jgi:hypothetical protein
VVLVSESAARGCVFDGDLRCHPSSRLAT